MIDATLREADQKMVKAVEVAKDDFASIRTGRAHPAMFHKLTADYYGTPTPIQQLASFTNPEPRVVVINVYDQQALAGIEKAIRDSDLGVNPTNNGDNLRVTMPELTEERRRDYIKVAKGKAEDARVSVRNIRRNAKQTLDRAQKDGEVSEDDLTGAEKRLDAMTKKHVDVIDDLVKHKEAELLEV
ncbi:MAG: ribosome recycling factor [Actinomycetota bacterium]|nr:ribosome recycling factor [Nocardioidaceae bacterium]MDQ3481689.1 ribosome recycling factor [Actinomycetota bacterium]